MATEQAIALAEQYDRAIADMEDRMIAQLDDALTTAYGQLEERIRSRYEAMGQDSTLLSDRREREVMRQLGETLTLIKPESADEYIASFERLFEDVTQAGGQMAIDLIRTVDPDSTVQALSGINVAAVAQVARDSWRDVERYNQQFADNVVRIIGSTIAMGGSSQSAIAQIRSQMGTTRAYAETLVRTRTMSALNGAARDRYAENGLDTQWMAINDEKLCPYCGYRNGKVYRSVDVRLPAHFRCRCIALPWSQEWAALGLTSEEFVEDYARDGIAKMEAIGRTPETGPTPFEQRDGIGRSPQPVHIPGQSSPISVVTRPAPAPQPPPEPPAPVAPPPAPTNYALPANHVLGSDRYTAADLDWAMDMISSPGAPERVAQVRRFVNRHNIRALVLDPRLSSEENVRRNRELIGDDSTMSPFFDRHGDGLLDLPPGVEGAVSSMINERTGERFISDYTVLRAREGRTEGDFELSFRALDSLVQFAHDASEENLDLWSFVSGVQTLAELGALTDVASSDDTEFFITYLHEMGHHIHMRGGYERYPDEQGIAYLTRYSLENDDEGFAENFVLWMLDAERYRADDPVGAEWIESHLRRALGEED